MANTQIQFLLISVCILVTQTTKGAFGAITKAPLNLVVYEGAIDTTITCESSSPYLDWRLSPFAYTDSSATNYLTSYGQLNPSFNGLFAIDHQQGTQVFTLVIFNATISPPEGWTYSTAGVYECTYVDNYDISYAVALLVVIRSDPVCSSNISQSTAMLQSGDVIQLSCTIVYGSLRYLAIDAVMNWTVNGQPIPAENVNFYIDSSSPTEVTASSTLLINDNFDATYECETTFSQPKRSVNGLANNAPDYFKTCSISPITTTTLPPSTTTTTTTPSTSTPTTTTAQPPCTGLFHFVNDLLRASCYTDWIVCSLEINILGIILFPDCRNHCKSQSYSSGTCISSSTSVGCPCIHPGNKKCICS